MKVSKIVKRYLYKISSILNEEKFVPIPQLIREKEILNGKTALVTGGSSGIGLEIAKELYRAGSNVIIAGRNEIKLEKAVEIILSTISSDNLGGGIIYCFRYC